MKKIPLTQGKFALCDDDDYDWLMQWKWHTDKGVSTYYARRSMHIGMTEDKRQKVKCFKMHRELLNAPLGLDIDHLNGNGLDNRRKNLRICTRRENGQNRHETASSKYPGVSWYKDYNKWRSVIQLDGKFKHLGYFDYELDAAQAYRKAAPCQI